MTYAFATAAAAKRARRLLRAGRITHREHALADCLLWSCRQPGTRFARVSYDRLQRLTRLARATIAAGLTKLERLGVLTRHPQRDGARVAVTLYELHDAPRSEFSAPTALCVQEITQEAQEARARLARISAQRERQLAEAWLARRQPPPRQLRPQLA